MDEQKKERCLVLHPVELGVCAVSKPYAGARTLKMRAVGGHDIHAEFPTVSVGCDCRHRLAVLHAANGT